MAFASSPIWSGSRLRRICSIIWSARPPSPTTACSWSFLEIDAAWRNRDACSSGLVSGVCRAGSENTVRRALASWSVHCCMALGSMPSSSLVRPARGSSSESFSSAWTWATRRKPRACEHFASTSTTRAPQAGTPLEVDGGPDVATEELLLGGEAERPVDPVVENLLDRRRDGRVVHRLAHGVAPGRPAGVEDLLDRVELLDGRGVALLGPGGQLLELLGRLVEQPGVVVRGQGAGRLERLAQQRRSPARPPSRPCRRCRRACSGSGPRPTAAPRAGR